MNQGQQGTAGAVSQFGASAVPQSGTTAVSQPGTAGANIAALQAAIEHSDRQSAAAREKSEVATPYQVGDTWSVRARREGCDIFLSGLKTSGAAAKELRYRAAYLEKKGKPHGKGPDQTSVAKAMQEHALKHLPSLKGAEQEARRVNRYLRDARLGTLELIDMSDVTDVKDLPKGACTGKYYAVFLKPYTASRVIPQGLADHRKLLMTKTGGSDRARAVIANLKMSAVKHDHLQDLVRALAAEGLAKATVKQEHALLRRLFNHARTKWHWPRPDINPADKLKLAGELVHREVVMSVEQQQRLDEALDFCINDLIGPAVQLLTETAMRADECIDTAKWWRGLGQANPPSRGRQGGCARCTAVAARHRNPAGIGPQRRPRRKDFWH